MLQGKRSVGTIGEDLSCTIKVGEFEVHGAMPVSRGGTGTGPVPGDFMRASIVACLAVGYRTAARDLGIPMHAIEIDMTCHIDTRGQDEADGGSPGWERIEWTVRVTSTADEADLLRLCDQVERRSPMLRNLDRRIERHRRLEVRRPA